jgi:peptide-methionine (S)-S-oxide reductase
MKNRVLIAAALIIPLLLASCTGKQTFQSKDGFTVLPDVKAGERVATFAGGCFWAMQECMLELKGVSAVVSGYAGGNTVNPTYDEVLTRKTGHAESVQVYYNPAVISFEQLVSAFFHSHNPTQIDRQGPDIGSDYRSIAFYRTAQERQVILNAMNRIDSSQIYNEPVATELTPIKAFYPAETAHQDYYQRNQLDPYIRNVSKPKVLKLRKTLPGLIKEEYID